MKNWTKEELIAEGYEIENIKIDFTDLKMTSNNGLTLNIGLIGDGWKCVYGGYSIGMGYLGATKFKGYASGVESIMRIMDVVGVIGLNELPYSYARVARKRGELIKIIGNIIEDKWFDITSFFKDKEAEHDIE